MTRSDQLAAAVDRLQDEYPTAWVPLHGSSKARVAFPLSDVDESPADLRRAVDARDDLRLVAWTLRDEELVVEVGEPDATKTKHAGPL